MNDIQRYAPLPQEWPMEDPNGDLVTYEDHKKIVDALEAEAEKLRGAVWLKVGECLAGMTHREVSPAARSLIEKAILAALAPTETNNG